MKNHYITISISAIITTFLSFFINPYYEFYVYIWSYVSFAFVLSVVLRVLYLKKRSDFLFLPALFITWLNFLQPYLKAEEVTYINRIIPEAFLFEMSFFSAFGIIGMYIGYYISFERKPVKPIFNFNVKFNAKQLGHIMLSVLFLFLVYKLLFSFFYMQLQSFKGLFAIIDYTPSLISAGLTLIILRKNGNILTIIILSVFIIIRLLLGIADTLFIRVLLIIIVPFIVYFFERKKVPFLTFLIAIIIVSPLFVLRHYYRKQAYSWWFGEKNATTAFLINQGVKILSETYGKDDIFDTSDKVIDADKKAESRFEQVSYLGQCVYYHEIKKNDFLNGKTFWWLPVAPVPRFILPFKPENLMSTKLADEYGLRGKGSTASMNWPMLAEYYINFGFLGIIIFSFFQGIAYKYTYKLIAFGKGDLNLIALFSLILPVIKIESNVTLVFGQVLQFLILWKILSLTFLKKYKYIKK